MATSVNGTGDAVVSWEAEASERAVAAASTVLASIAECAVCQISPKLQVVVRPRWTAWHVLVRVCWTVTAKRTRERRRCCWGAVITRRAVQARRPARSWAVGASRASLRLDLTASQRAGTDVPSWADAAVLWSRCGARAVAAAAWAVESRDAQINGCALVVVRAVETAGARQARCRRGHRRAGLVRSWRARILRGILCGVQTVEASRAVSRISSKGTKLTVRSRRAARAEVTCKTRRTRCIHAGVGTVPARSAEEAA